MGKSAICTLCGAEFKSKTNIYKHMRSLHNMVLRTAPAQGLLCPLCKTHSFRHSNFRQHLQTEHDINVEMTQMEFRTMEDFETWKKDTEEATFTSYIRHTAPKKLQSSFLRSYYFCHRGGYSKEKLETKKHSVKNVMSCKIQGACPASMELTYTGEKYKVIHYKTHVGHDIDVQALPVRKINLNKPVLVLPLNSSFSVSMMHHDMPMKLD